MEEAEELLNWEAVTVSWCFSSSDDVKYRDADNMLALEANTTKLFRVYPVRPLTL
jgi:hypothetical protein